MGEVGCARLERIGSPGGAACGAGRAAWRGGRVAAVTRDRALVLAGLLATLAVSWTGIVSSERLIASGETVYLEIVPVDPRSLMQGDYMALDWQIGRDAAERMQQDDARAPWPTSGVLLVRVDERGIGEFVERAANGALPAAGHLVLKYRIRGERELGGFDARSLEVGTDAWFFEEGRAEQFEKARYGEMRVDGDGDSILVRMRDENLAALGDPLPRW